VKIYCQIYAVAIGRTTTGRKNTDRSTSRLLKVRCSVSARDRPSTFTSTKNAPASFNVFQNATRVGVAEKTSAKLANPIHLAPPTPRQSVNAYTLPTRDAPKKASAKHTPGKTRTHGARRGPPRGARLNRRNDQRPISSLSRRPASYPGTRRPTCAPTSTLVRCLCALSCRSSVAPPSAGADQRQRALAAAAFVPLPVLEVALQRALPPARAKLVLLWKALLDTAPVPRGQPIQTTKTSELAPRAAGYCSAHSRRYRGFTIVALCATDGTIIGFGQGRSLRMSTIASSRCLIQPIGGSGRCRSVFAARPEEKLADLGAGARTAASKRDRRRDRDPRQRRRRRRVPSRWGA